MTRNEPLTITDFDFRDGTPLDQMRTPTMNEFTAAIEACRVLDSWPSNRANNQGVLGVDKPVEALAPCVIDRAACAADAIQLLHGLRLQYLSAIPDAGYRKLMDAEDHLNKKLSAYLTGKADL